MGPPFLAHERPDDGDARQPPHAMPPIERTLSMSHDDVPLYAVEQPACRRIGLRLAQKLAGRDNITDNLERSAPI